MVRRSPQKKKTKPIGAKSGPGSVAVVKSNPAAEADVGQSGVNWWSPGQTPSLAPDSEPWTPTNHSHALRNRSPLRSPTKPLEQQVSSLQAQREAADADLWNARVELQEHAYQKEANEERIMKLQSEVARLRTDHEQDSQALDELRSHDEELQTLLERERTKASRDRQLVREQLEDRDNFIENLQAQLDELRGELRASSAPEAGHSQDTRVSDDTASGAGDFTSLTIDLESDSSLVPPAATAVPQTASANELLSHTHQAKQQRSLRNALHKQRLENFQLRQQLAELKGGDAPHWEEGPEQDSDFEPNDEDVLGAGHQKTPEISHSSIYHDNGSSLEIPPVPSGVPLSDDFIDEAQFQRDAEHLGLALVPAQKLAELQKSHSKEDSLETLTHQLRDHYDAHVVPSDELEALRNPNFASLHRHAHAINHRLVPIQEYDALQNEQAITEKLKLSDEELKLAYELLRGRRHCRTNVHSHVLHDLARNQALGLAADKAQRSASTSPSRPLEKHHHRTQSSASSASDVTSGWSDPLSSEDGVGAALRQIALNHGFELVSDTAVGIRELATRHGLATIPVDRVAVLSNSHILPDSTALSSHTDEVVLALSQSDANRIQDQLGASVTPKEVSELKRRAYNPTASEITDKAAALGLAVLPLETVAEMKGQLRQPPVPDASSVAEFAQRAGLRVIPDRPTLDELREIAPEDAVLVEREAWAALEYPEPATLTRLAKVHGLCLLPEEELEKLKRRVAPNAESGHSTPPPSEQMTVENLRKAAQAHDLVVLSADDYRAIISNRQTRDFSNLPMSARTEHFENLIKSSQEARSSVTSPRGSPATGSLGSLSDRITRLGFVPVEQEEYQRLLASQKVYEPTKSDILRAAKQFGLATMPVDEYVRLRSSHWSSPNKSSSGGSPTAKAMSPSKGDLSTDDDLRGFQAVPSDYLAALRRIVEHPTRSDVESLAHKLGLDIIDHQSDTEILQKAKALGLTNPLSEAELVEAGKARGLVEPLDDEQTLYRAKELGLSEPLSESELREKAKSLGFVEHMTNEEIVKAAKSLGLAEQLTDEQLVEAAKSLGLTKPLTDAEIVERAKAMGLAEPMDDTSIINRAMSLGLVQPLGELEVLRQAKALGLVKPPVDSETLEKAKALGLVDPLSEPEILEIAKSKGLTEPLSENVIIRRAKALGLIDPLVEAELLPAAKAKGLTEPLSDDSIISRAESLGLSWPLSESEILEAARAKGLTDPLSDSEIITSAMTLGLVHPLSDLEILKTAKSKGLVEPLSEEETVRRAKKLGLIDPPTEADVLSAAKARGLEKPPSDREVVERAKALGLINPLSENEILETAKSMGLLQPLTDSEVVEKAKIIGLIEPPTETDFFKAAKDKGFIKKPEENEVIRWVESLPFEHELLRQFVLERAKHLGLVVPPSDAEVCARAKTLGLAEEHSDEHTLARAEQLGLAKPLDDTQIRERAGALGLVAPLSEAEIKSKAKSLGLAESPTDDEIAAKAKTLGMVNQATKFEILDQAKALGLVEAPSEAEILRRAKVIGLTDPMSEDEIVQKAKSLGMVEAISDSQILDKARARGLVDPPSDEEIVTRAMELGLVKPLSDSLLIKKAKTLGLIEPLSKDEIVEKAQDLGMVVKPSDALVIEKAKSLGLVNKPSEAEIVQQAKSLDIRHLLSKDELILHAKALGMDFSPPKTEGKSPSMSQNLAEFNDSMTSVSKKLDADGRGIGVAVAAGANRSELVKSPQQRGSDGSGPTSTVTSNKPEARKGSREGVNSTSHMPNDVAASTVSPRTLGRMPSDSTTLPNAAATATESVTAKSLSDDVKDSTVPATNPPPIPVRVRSDHGASNLRVIPSLAPEAAVALSAESGSTNGSHADPSVIYGPEGPGQVTSTGLPQHLGESPVRRGVRRYDASTGQRSPTKGMSRSATSAYLHGSRTKETRSSLSSSAGPDKFNLPMPRSNSFHPQVPQQRYSPSLADSAASSWAAEPLAGDAADTTVSQIVLGEVLYKYTTGFTFEGITGGRHKRYFWFRPDSMTLYWHRENPHILASLYGPAKFVRVEAVEDFSDRNPIPAGLYHRSILIKGRERDVRITCSNASRHRVWLSSLQYLLNERKSSRPENSH